MQQVSIDIKLSIGMIYKAGFWLMQILYVVFVRLFNRESNHIKITGFRSFIESSP